MSVWVWLGLAVVLVAFFVWWMSRPVTWRDAEGPILNEDDVAGDTDLVDLVLDAPWKRIGRRLSQMAGALVGGIERCFGGGR